MMEFWGMDQDEIRGVLEDLGDGGVPGVSGASLDSDGEAFEFGWERAGVPLEASSPDTILQLGRGPSRDGFGGCGLDRRDRLIRVRLAGTVHTLPLRSISAHSAHRTSPHLAAVSTRNSRANLAVGSAADAHTVRMAADTSRCGKARMCSVTSF